MSKNLRVRCKPDPMDAIVGERLKKRRLLLRISQQDLARAINVSPQQIRKYECGANRVTSGKLYCLAEMLRVPIEYFFDLYDKNHTQEGAENEMSHSKERVEEQEISELLCYFNMIKNTIKRKKVLDLVKSLATTS